MDGAKLEKRAKSERMGTAFKEAPHLLVTTNRLDKSRNPTKPGRTGGKNKSDLHVVTSKKNDW